MQEITVCLLSTADAVYFILLFLSGKMNQQDFTAFVLPFLRLLLLKNVNIISLACPWGYYGQNCASKCKDRCMGCNNINGLCDYGCSPGWKGQNCNIGIGNKKNYVQFL